MIQLTKKKWVIALGVLILSSGLIYAKVSSHRILWKIVSNECLPHYQAEGNPSPCTTVDTAKDYAILKDILGASQYLLIPLHRISGIEDTSLQEPKVPDYWQSAWEARHFVEKALGHSVSRDKLSLAVNSVYGRSQDQFHIHIECIAPATYSALHKHEQEITTRWMPLTVMRHIYEVRRIEGETLENINPVQLVLEAFPGARESMGDYTIFISGAFFPDRGPGFYLFVDHAHSVSGDNGHAEELQDHGCSIARQ